MTVRLEGTASVSFIADKLRAVPKASQRAVRKAIVSSTSGLRSDMARRASWSTRIPGAIGMRVSFARASVELRVNSKRAPHARPYEGMGSPGTFRHPVYGHRTVWVSQATRPFFFPAVQGKRQKIRDAVETAIIATLPR